MRGNPSGGVYDKVEHYSTVYDALAALKKMEKGDLQSVRTFIVEDRIPALPADSRMDEYKQELFGDGEVPDREMRAVFLGGKVREIFRQQGLSSPPIVMGTVIDANMERTFPHIDGAVMFDGKSDLARKFSNASDRISTQRIKA